MRSLIIKRVAAVLALLAVSGAALAASTLQGLDFRQGPSSLSDLRLMDELRRGFFTPPVLVLVLLCGS